MRISARGISKGRALPQVTVHARSGEVRLVAVEGGRRPTVLGLLLSGRMSPDTGEVTVDGDVDHARLRRGVALIDAPDVSAPYDDLTLESVLREELAFAGVRRTRQAAARMLAEWDAAGYGDTPVRDVPAALRVRALTEAATTATGIEAAVLVSPDRHGGEPSEWRDVAQRLAERGLAVIVLAGSAAIAALEAGEGSAAATDPPAAAEPDPSAVPEARAEPTPDPAPAEPDPAPAEPEPTLEPAGEPGPTLESAGDPGPDMEPAAEPVPPAESAAESAPQHGAEPHPAAEQDPRPDPASDAPPGVPAQSEEIPS